MILQMIKIGVLETILSLILGLVICKRDLSNVTPKKSIYLLAKLLVATVITLAIITTGKMFIKNLAITTLISILAYTISFKGILRLNYRQSVLSAMLVLFSLVVVEVTTYPVIEQMMEHFATKNEFILVLPARALQATIIFVLLKNKFSLSNNSLLTKKWSSLTFQNKITFFFLIFLVFADIMFNANYIAITLKMQSKNIEPQFINFNLFLYLLQTILFMGVVVISFTRTIDYEKNKEVLNKDPFEFFEEILNKSTQDEIYKYSKLIIRALHINSIENIDKVFSYLKSILKRFDYHINENIAFVDHDYTNLLGYIEFLITVPVLKEKSIFADVSQDNENIKCTIHIENINELEKRKFEKELFLNETYKELRSNLISQKSVINVMHHENDMTFTIKSPITKYYSEVGSYESK